MYRPEDPELMEEDEDAWEEGGPDEGAHEEEIDPAALLDRFRSLTGQVDPSTAGSSESPAESSEYLGADAVPVPTDQQMMELEAEAVPPRPEQPSEDPIFQVINIDDDDEEPEVRPAKVTWTSMPGDRFLDAWVVTSGETVHVASHVSPRIVCRDQTASLGGDQEKAGAGAWLCKQN